MKKLLIVAVACLGVLHAVPVQAQSSKIPAEDFARRPTVASPKFSPDGKKIAALRLIEGRMNLVTIDTEKNVSRQLTDFKDVDVGQYRWISNSRLMMQTTDLKSGLGQQHLAGRAVYAIDFDGGTPATIAPSPDTGRVFQFVAGVPNSEDEVLAIMPFGQRTRSGGTKSSGTSFNVSAWRADSWDLVRLNTRNLQFKVLSDPNPGYVQDHWIVDKDGAPRAALGSTPDRKGTIFWFREDVKSPWREAGRYPLFSRITYPVDFDADGSLYVLSNTENDTFALYKWDAQNNRLGERIARHPTADLNPFLDPTVMGSRFSPLVMDAKEGKVIGISIDADQPMVEWFDPKLKRVQATIDASMPKGNINEIQTLGGGKYVIFSSGDRDPGAYYIFDENNKKLTEQLRPRDWIKPAQMGETRVIRYKARDGLEIPAYLTLPAGKDPKSLPLVVWVHGGPWARDHYGWSREVQFMASRGYAVLQPNYRGSQGFGVKHLTSSFKKLGQTMQDDVTDGVRKLIADGLVDGKRVCIGGGSYGGYATMMGLVREPDLFKCGINVVGVTDLKWWIDLGYTDFNSVDAIGAEQSLKVMVGDPSVDQAMMEANSPRLQADKIKAPVLFIHGGQDQRVPIVHAESMRDALRRLDKPYEWLVFPEEGHGWVKESNWVTYLNAVEKFLAKHLGN